MKKDGRYYLVHYSGNASYVELPKQFRDSGNVVASYGVRGYAFAHMEYVSHVSLGDGVSFLEDYALCDSHVTHLHIGDDLASIGNMAFFGMSELTSFSVSNNNDCFSTDGNGILFNKDKTTLIHFPRKLGLTSYTVPDSVRTIMDYAILGESLSSLTLGLNVVEIGENNFGSITELTIQNDVQSVDIGPITTLVCVNIGKNVTDLSHWGFKDDSSGIYNKPGLSRFGYYSLEKFVVSEENKHFTSSDGILYNKDMSVLLMCPNTLAVDSIIDGVIKIADYAFKGCHNVTTMVLCSDVTEIGVSAFEYCENIRTVSIPDSVMTIGDSAFSCCYSLSSITIPDSVTTIGDHAFWNCEFLSSVIISDSVTSIGTYAFSECRSLKDVTIGKNITTLYGNPFYRCSPELKFNYGGDNSDYTLYSVLPFGKRMEITEERLVGMEAFFWYNGDVFSTEIRIEESKNIGDYLTPTIIGSVVVLVGIAGLIAFFIRRRMLF